MDSETIETQLESLHRERGRLALAGKDPSKVTAEIMRLHQDMATLLDAENAKAEQSREAQAKAFDEQVAALERDITHHRDARAKAKATADKLLSDWAGLMKLAYQNAAQESKAVGKLNELTGRKQSGVNVPMLQRQDSLLLCEHLRQVSGNAGRYGIIEIKNATKTL